MLALTAVASAVFIHSVPARATSTYSYWAPWYDNASPGMGLDNIHVLNANPTPANVTIKLPGAPDLGGQVPAYGEGYFNWQAEDGGPLHIVSDQPVTVTQRVTYGYSFNEVPALPETSEGKSFWFPWYDLGSPGFRVDNIHVLNPGGATAHVSLRLGNGVFTYSLSVNPMSATYYAFPSGFVGGPVHVVSDQPVLVSQRVLYNQSFNEIPGVADTDAAQFVVFNWYDQASPGFDSDAIHVVNPSSTATATVAVNYRGAPARTLTLGPQTANWLNFPGTIGGPVTLTANIPIIATQRVEYWSSFKEYTGLTQATTDGWFNWYDNASPCFLQNNIHLFTTGHAWGTISIGSSGRSIPFDVTGEGYFSFPLGTIGGPVHIVAAAGSDPFYPESRTVRCPPPPPPAPPPPTPLPVRLRVPGLGIYANVESVGADAQGNMGVPTSAWDVGWFNLMPRPGDSGDAVMTGHVDWYGVPCAVFCYLTSSWIGMDVYVDRQDGSTVHFVVDGMNYYPATSPPDWLYTTQGSPQLTLITCAGEFVGGHYKDRFLVHTHMV